MRWSTESSFGMGSTINWKNDWKMMMDNANLFIKNYAILIIKCFYPKFTKMLKNKLPNLHLGR